MLVSQIQAETTLVCIPNEKVLCAIEAESFLDASTLFVTPDHCVGEKLRSRGYKGIVEYTYDSDYVHLPHSLGKVIVFENHIVETFDNMKILKKSTTAPIIVVTFTKAYPTMLYYSFGARTVIYSNNHNFSFLTH